MKKTVNRRPPNSLRDDEKFVIAAVSAAFSARWRPGEDPPDAYLTLGGKTVAVEISTLMQPVTDERGTRSRLTDDLPTAALGEELNLELQALIPDGYRVSLILRSPILARAKTKRKIASLIRSLLHNILTFPPHYHLAVNDNPVSIYLDYHGDAQQKKVTVGFMHRKAVADLGANTRYILEERINVKAVKCKHLVGRGPLWLALLNDYWLADADTYRYALSLLSVKHPFDKILIVSGGGLVDGIFGEGPPAPQNVRMPVGEETRVLQTAPENRRIHKIRSSIREEKQLVSNLAHSLTDAHLKERLKLATNWLGDAETFFLDEKILQEPRTEAAFAAWLGQAEILVKDAIKQRKFVEDIVKKYGLSARTIPV
jgi:hypothetical protein